MQNCKKNLFFSDKINIDLKAEYILDYSLMKITLSISRWSTFMDGHVSFLQNSRVIEFVAYLANILSGVDCVAKSDGIKLYLSIASYAVFPIRDIVLLKNIIIFNLIIVVVIQRRKNLVVGVCQIALFVLQSLGDQLSSEPKFLSFNYPEYSTKKRPFPDMSFDSHLNTAKGVDTLAH